MQIVECDMCGVDVVPTLGAAVRCVHCLERFAHYACAFVTLEPWACARCTAESRSAHGILNDIQARTCPLRAGNALTSAPCVLPGPRVGFPGTLLALAWAACLGDTADGRHGSLLSCSCKYEPVVCFSVL